MSRKEAFGEMTDVCCTAGNCNATNLIQNCIQSVRATVSDVVADKDASIMKKINSSLNKNDRRVYLMMSLSIVFLIVATLIACGRRKRWAHAPPYHPLYYPNTFSPL